MIVRRRRHIWPALFKYFCCGVRPQPSRPSAVADQQPPKKNLSHARYRVGTDPWLAPTLQVASRRQHKPTSSWRGLYFPAEAIPKPSDGAARALRSRPVDNHEGIKSCLLCRARRCPRGRLRINSWSLNRYTQGKQPADASSSPAYREGSPWIPASEALFDMTDPSIRQHAARMPSSQIIRRAASTYTPTTDF